MSSINFSINFFKLFFIFLAIFHTVDSSAQPIQLLNFEKLTINDGLSQGFIYNIGQDEKGFIWFCTPDGLNRYDGYHFKIYRHDDADSFSVSSNLVTKFFTAVDKNIWIATNDNGLNYFDLRYQKFYHFFPGMAIEDITEDRHGNLILLSGDKVVLSKVKVEGGKDKKFFIDTAVFNFPDALINTRGFLHYHIFCDVYKNLFLSTHEAIFKLDIRQNNKLFIVKLCSFPTMETREPKVIEDKTTHKFYAYIHANLFEFADSSFSNPGMVAAPPGIEDIFIDSQQRLWLLSTNKIFILDLKTKAITNVVSKSNDIDNLLKAAYCSFEDKNNNLWIGTSGLGILKFTNELNVFHHLLPDEYIYKLQQYNKETALIEGRFKVIFSSNNMVQIDLVNLAAKRKKNFDPAMKYIVDNKYNYWFLQDNKLQMYNAVHKKLKTIFIRDKLKKEMTLLPLQTKGENKSDFLFIDKHNNLWFQCYNKIMSYAISADSLTVYSSLPVFKDVDRSFRVMYEDVNGILWITTSQNFYSYNPVNGKTNFFYHTLNDTGSVAGSNISCFCDDPLLPSQFLWVGTRGNGVSRLNKTTGRCQSFNTKNGLPNNVIYGLLSDNYGNIWGSTNKGLFRMNVKNGAVKNFDVTDGLQGNEFNRFAYLKLDNGVMIFGGLNGINYFKPEEIQAITPPEVQLINIRLLDKTLSVNDSKSLMNIDVSYLKEFSIKSNQNAISFEFAALDYKKIGAVYYRYKLDGFDNDWNNAGLSNTATYTNLDPDDYELIVQASNDNINWGDEMQLLSLHVLPMWWQTWLFKITVACLTLSVVYAIYRYRLQTLLHIQQVRNDIAKDLHDEIGSALSSISIYSKVAQRHEDNKETNPNILLKKISDNADKMMDSMYDIVWSINAKNDGFENIFYRMREHAMQLLESKNYVVHFDFDETLMHTKLDMQSRRHFYLIYKEALNNIVKYADGNEVWISLIEKNGFIQLTIHDNGKGFDIKRKSNGNGLLNMQTRANDLHAALAIMPKPGEGTTIMLSFKQNS